MRIQVLAGSVLVSILALLAAGCGDGGGSSSGSGSSSGGGSDALTNCKAVCAAQAMGTNCSPGASDVCNQLCTQYDFTGDCEVKANVYFACAVDASWCCAT